MAAPIKQPQVTHEEENPAKRPQPHCHIECNVRLEKLENLPLFDYNVRNKYFP